ncbi:ankyrin-1-like [Sitodiplosis mosellana]|uniref:ankyrin-1-like n=1 Tax=Sitodiplosis mosellana TaxID=263140 RepID=UPI0024438241|nr:ankyrin-1-like [Sitodiplosis mosellana]
MKAIFAIALFIVDLNGLLADDKKADESLSSKMNELRNAIKYESTFEIRDLIRQGMDVNAHFDDGQTPIHVAADVGNANIAELFLDHGANVNILSLNGIPALHMAARKGHQSVVEILVKKNANVNFQERNFRNTSLHVAADKGFESIVKYLIDNYANINVTDKNGHSPLYYALKKGHKKVAVILIENGTNIDFELGDWKGLIFRCVVDQVQGTQRRNRLIAKLNNRGIDTDVDWPTAFIEAIKKGDAFSTEFIAKNCINNLRGMQWSVVLAARTGQAEIVKLLIEIGVNASLPDANGTLALFVAVENGHDKVVEILTQSEVDINIKNRSGKTALHVAIEAGSTKMVECLIRNSANVNMKDSQENSPLMLALKKGNDNITLLLIDNNADQYLVHKEWGPACFGCITRIASRSIIEAFNRKSVRMEQDWKQAIQRTVDVDDARGTKMLIKCCFEDGDVQKLKELHLLHLAAEKGNVDVAKVLISRGVEVDAKNDQQETALHFAARYGRLEVAKILIEHRADVNARNGVAKRTPLHLVVVNGSGMLARVLCDNGADVNALNVHGDTPLSDAVLYSALDVVKVLVEHNAKLYTAAIHDAAIHDQTGEITKFFIEHGANINRVNDGETPLHAAARHGRTGAAKVLIDHGANVNFRIKDGETPLHLAARHGRVEIVEHLIERGADVNAKTEFTQRTPLHFTSNGYGLLTRVLCDNGADINSSDRFKSTPLNDAVINAALDVINVLLEYGAKVNDKAIRDAAIHNPTGKITKKFVDHGVNVNLGNNDRRLPSRRQGALLPPPPNPLPPAIFHQRVRLCIPACARSAT